MATAPHRRYADRGMPDDDDKLMFPDAGLRKSDVIAHYEAVADVLLQHAAGRFLTLHRFPDGIDADGFYQQRRPDHFPDSVIGDDAPTADGSETVHYMRVDSAAGLTFLADQAAITLHGWLSRADRPDHPDKLLFDLDPAGDDFAPVIDCARRLRDALSDRGLTPFVMTTGSRGLHVAAPLDRKRDFDTVRAFARDVGHSVADAVPDRFTMAQRKSKRGGRLYIDTSRNAYGQTAVVPYALRALPGAPVATPLDWDELGGVDPQRYRLENIRRRLGQKACPWRDFFEHATGIG